MKFANVWVTIVARCRSRPMILRENVITAAHNLGFQATINTRETQLAAIL